MTDDISIENQKKQMDVNDERCASENILKEKDKLI